MGFLRLQVTTSDPLSNLIDTAVADSTLMDVNNYLVGLPEVNKGTMNVTINPVQATATITFTGAPSNNETCSIANVTFTAKTSGATGNQFNISGSTVTATNLAAAINASANMAGICTAQAASGVVTITAVIAGAAGNGLQISESLTNATNTAFASGAEGSTAVNINYGT